MEDLRQLYKIYPFNSIEKLFRKAKEMEIDVNRKDIQKFLKSHSISQITKSIRKPKHFRGLISSYIRQYFQMDIIIYDNHAFNGYKYILGCIDVYSRTAYAIPLKSRKANIILDNIKEMFDIMGIPEKLFVDNEFNNRIFNEYFEKNNITVIYSDPEDLNKNVYIERWNGTLRRLLQRYMLLNKTSNWIDLLDDVLMAYNNTVHSSTKEKPLDIWKGEATSKKLYRDVKNIFEVGDLIRIQSKKKVFDKGSESVLSTDIYLIEKIKGKRFTVKNMKTGDIKEISEQRAVKVTQPIEDDDIDMVVLDEPKRKKKAEAMFKKSGLDESNIIEGKRERKPNKRYTE